MAPTVAISLKFVPSVDLSILKPDSSAEPSVHARLIELLLAAAAVNPLGGLGGAGGTGLPFIIVCDRGAAEVDGVTHPGG